MDISDIDIEIIEKDSGMSSLGGSKDDTPERRAIKDSDSDENYDDEPDETLAERLWGLTEMFPEPIRNICGVLSNFTASTVKNAYSFSCNASWIFFTSSMILFAPVIFETERAQTEEMQKTQQKQVLLGPGAVGLTPTSGNSSGTPALPPMHR
ncbi:mitochondrial import receptor subunit TOM22 homolog [Condylostylus longicornis]|uniref:mitochondrial import receptor subunit TOM22 homolog n=1 Tax=Condylostylus longicornis TaxID=2530218 RepID=UPI00244E012B|nr:mitochondrial import receptor subunit TOM22 homolog [Condylostylus longicornis]